MGDHNEDGGAQSGIPPFMSNAGSGAGRTKLMLLSLDGKSKRLFWLPGVIGVSFDERARWKAVERGHEVQWSEQQRVADFLSVVQNVTLGSRVKAPAPGECYSVLVADRGFIFGGVADHVTVAPNGRGGAIVHSHFTKVVGGDPTHLQATKRSVDGRDLRPKWLKVFHFVAPTVKWPLYLSAYFLAVALSSAAAGVGWNFAVRATEAALGGSGFLNSS